VVVDTRHARDSRAPSARTAVRLRRYAAVAALLALGGGMVAFGATRPFGAPALQRVESLGRNPSEQRVASVPRPEPPAGQDQRMLAGAALPEPGSSLSPSEVADAARGEPRPAKPLGVKSGSTVPASQARPRPEAVPELAAEKAVAVPLVTPVQDPGF
jgi:hypothetical protein